jgi:pyruvate formate lyase activating enzyme
MSDEPTEPPAPEEESASPLAGTAATSQVANESLAQVLDRHTVPGALWKTEGERVRCVACAHRCLLAPGRRGVCKLRFNQDGQLRVPFGYVSGLASDPVEKKPFFHLYPGSDALTFGMLGCNFHCPFCQNWVTSQALRDGAAGAHIQAVTPEQMVAAARRHGATLMVSSYNEPLITAEWAGAVFQRAKAAGLVCAMVSNGNATPEVLAYLRPWMTGYKVDLKCYDERHYRSLGGSLAKVTEAIRLAHQQGFWVEIVTLLVPGFNDSEAELRALTGFIASVSTDIPWHVTAFHPNYRMTEPRATQVHDLLRAAELGVAQGLRFVYAGNLPGRVGEWEDTRCPGCGKIVIKRIGFSVEDYQLTTAGRCRNCQRFIPGVWPGQPSPAPAAAPS